MSSFSSKVAVTFIDAVSGATIGATEMSPTDLPESFSLETTLQIGDDEWSVIEAVPASRSEYAKTERLVLRLRRVEMVDPHDILFSLPSICDALPRLSDQPLTGGEVVLSEDDWRQFEFVSRANAHETDRQLEAIRRIHADESVGGGWRKIHVRTSPEPPIVSPLPLGEVRRILGIHIESNGVAIHGVSSPIEFGFSFRAVDGQTVYGLAPQGIVIVLGLAEGRLPKAPTQTIAALGALATEYELELVHWCRCGKAAPDHPLFHRLISDNAD